MRTVQLYINNRRVDLFNDEQIEVTSSTQNIQDIAKVYTDYSQTFTVPASKANNAIFEHYYNNDVNATFQAKNRQPARIEINNTPFRRGKIQLEGAEIVDGEAQSYKITFYGDVVTLKDLFGDDKLSDLDYSAINHERSGANIQTSITSTSDLDVRYPLISSSRVWQYGDATSNDISLSGNAIDFSELFPALKVSKVFEAIESTYSVTFNGNFLSNKRFTNLFTWWKNRETANIVSEPLPLEFNSGGASCNAVFTNGEGVGINEVVVKYIDLATYTQPVDWDSWVGTGSHQVQVFIYNTSTSATYYLDVFKNGIYQTTQTGVNSSIYNIVQVNIPSLDDTYTFQVRADSSMTFDFQVKYIFQSPYYNTSNVLTPYEKSCTFTETSNTITNYMDWNTTAPDMRVADYFSGVLRMFNLTCYPLDDEFNFQVEPLDEWYANGEDIDITKYVDVDSILIDRPKLYNEIAFDWKESKSFMNIAYSDFNGKQYGSLREFFGYDGGEFKVELPFETLLFNKFDGENLQVGYSLETAPDYKPYIPGPVMLYLYESQTCDFYFDNGTTTANITSYMPFGQDVYYNFNEYTLNFNEEFSSLTLDPESNSLYKTYYQRYLVNLFNNKTRIVTVKCNLPLRLLNYISLQDGLIIRDKKYRINEVKTNLTSGEVRLVLISDWNVVRERVLVPNPIVPEGGGDIVVPVKPVKPNKGGYVNISPAGTFTTPNVTGDVFTEQDVTITVDPNTTGSDRSEDYTFTYYAPDGTTLDTIVITITQEGSSSFLLQEDGSNVLLEELGYLKL